MGELIVNDYVNLSTEEPDSLYNNINSNNGIPAIVANGIISSHAALHLQQQHASNHTLLDDMEKDEVNAKRIAQETGMGRYRTDLPFPMQEYVARVRAVRAAMRRDGIDVLMLTQLENIHYLTGYQTVGEPTVQTLLLPLDPGERIILVTRKLEKSNVDFRTWLSREQRKSFGDDEDAFLTLLRTIEAQGHHAAEKVFGIEEGSASHKELLHRFLVERLPSVRFVDCTSLVGKLRLFKSALELRKIEQASHMTVAGIRAMMEAVRVSDTTENAVAAEGYHALFKAGSTYAGYPIFVSSGPHGSLGHATSQTRSIQSGDIVFLELTGIKDRYAAPIMRTMYMGSKMPDWLEYINACVLRAVQLSMKAMKPGVRANDVDKIARDIIQECSKYVKQKWNLRVTQLARSAYSVGVNFMIDWGEGELLSIGPSESRELGENMVFHLIPWVQIFDCNRQPIGGIGLSETVVVTKEGGRSVFEGYELPHGIVCASNNNNNNNNIGDPVLSKGLAKVPDQMQSSPKYDFTSDNAAAVHPKVMASICQANGGFELAYSNDQYTARARKMIQDQFGTGVDSMIVTTGTAANVIGLASMLPMMPTGAIICHARSHLNTDEGGAPECFMRAKLLTVESSDGKITGHHIEDILSKHPAIPHRVQPLVVSIAQPTELGTVYTKDELRLIAQTCKTHGLSFHMDGSRLSNAAAALGTSLSDISIGAGVDMLTLGFSKNGAMDAEIIVTSKHSKELLSRIVKQGMHLKSKARFSAAQVIAMLREDLYMTCARHANDMATRLYNGVRLLANVQVEYPVESNTVLLRLPNANIVPLKERYPVVTWIPGDQSSVVRLMCSWDTKPEAVDSLVVYLHSILSPIM